MNKQDLKKIIKPLVKECINEVILSEGLLASIISEVVTGLGTSPSLVEHSNTASPRINDNAPNAKKLQETRERMLNAIGKDAYKGVNVFEGLAPVPAAAPSASASAHNPLANVDPQDSGVDLSTYFAGMSDKWGKIAKGGQNG